MITTIRRIASKCGHFAVVWMVMISMPASLVAGNYDRDVEQAVRDLKYQKDPEKKAYEDALKSYKERREQILNEMIGVLGRRSASEDISSPWSSWSEDGVKAVALLQGGILLAFKEHRPEEDFSIEKTGLKEFVERETRFFETLKSKQVFPLARKRVLEIKEQTSMATKNLDEKWKSIERDDAAIDKILEDCKSEIRQTIDMVRVTLREVKLAMPPESSIIGILQYVIAAYSKSKAAQAGEQKVWRTFIAEREVATKIHEQINFAWVEESIKLAKSGSESTSEWTSRQDYPAFQSNALKVLDDHAKGARDAYNQFMQENKGRFYDNVESKWAEILTDPQSVMFFKELFELEGATLIELIEKHESAINSLTDGEIKTKWKEVMAKLKLDGKESIVRWKEGYELHKRVAQECKLAGIP